MSILRYLAIHRRAALTFATTHHGELKTLKYSKDDSAQFFENASVEFDDVQMRPTYRLVWGIPGRSNALAIAERLGLRDNIIEEARYLLNGINADGEGDENRVDIEKMISSLERDKNAAETAREGAERALRKVDAMKVELQERLERLRVSETELRKEQKAAMETEIREAKKQIARLIKEMQQGGGSAQSASRASEKLNSLLIPGSTPKKGIAEGYSGLTDVDELKVGDKIVVPRLGSVEMDVVEKLSKKEVLVSLGAMKAKVKVKEIAAVRHVQSPVSQAPQYERKEESRKQIAVRTAANSIDIRGERVEGAQVMVDKALDKALALGTLWVIHGHGTGRLRNGIRDFLQNHHLVERIQDAEQAEGGRGVTVTYLK